MVLQTVQHEPRITGQGLEYISQSLVTAGIGAVTNQLMV